MTGHGGDLNWLMDALKLLDFNYNIFYQECIMIGFFTKGIFSVEFLKNIPFDEYEMIKGKTEELNKES